MTPQMLFLIFMSLGVAAYWRDVVSLVLAAMCVLMVLGVVQLYQIFTGY